MDIFDHLQPDGSDKSIFVMCRPEFLSTKIPNNVFMEGKQAEKPDVPRALRQWDNTAHLIEAFGVTVLEMPPEKGCQDMVYCANIGMNVGETFVLSNYKAAGRQCEVEPARKFFSSLGFNCIQPPFQWEGLADCKRWKENIYFGGFGLFSTNEAFDWIEKQCGVQIIRLQEINPKAYHLDCDLLVVDEENFIVLKSGLDAKSIKTLEKLGNVIFTPPGCDTTGITNGVKIPEKRIYMSGCFNQEIPAYRKGSEWLMDTMDKLGYSMVFVDVDSYNPSGADLSCSVLQLYPPFPKGIPQ